MHRWVWGLCALWISCSPTPPPARGDESLPTAEGSRSPCEELRRRLPPVAPPLEIPTGHSADPFPPEVQEWLKKHLPPAGVYAPLGQWKGPTNTELWLIEFISAEGAIFYAVLADSACGILDTMRWAYQQVYPDRVEQAQARLARDGTCIVRLESRQTEFVGEEPRTTTTTGEKQYQVDWAAGKLRAL